MLALRYAALLALTIWVGGLLVLGAIAAPSMFDVLSVQAADGRALAGQVFGEALRRFHLLGYACAAVLLGSLVMRAVLGPRPRWFTLRAGLTLAMLAASVYSGMVVSSRIEDARAAIGVSPSSLPELDPRRAQFGRLHATSSALQAIPLVGGLILLFFEAKESIT